MHKVEDRFESGVLIESFVFAFERDFLNPVLSSVSFTFLSLLVPLIGQLYRPCRRHKSDNYERQWLVFKYALHNKAEARTNDDFGLLPNRSGWVIKFCRSKNLCVCLSLSVDRLVALCLALVEAWWHLSQTWVSLVLGGEGVCSPALAARPGQEGTI